MSKQTIWTGLGAAQLARQLADGAVSSQEAVEQHIARAQAVQPALKAVTQDLFESARAAAREADAARARGDVLGPLHGVPVTIKECLDLVGTASTFGLSSRTGHRATRDELHVARLKAAGAIPIAKSNVAQWLLYYEADNPVYGATNNPYSAARTPGGSSGGEAALVAAGASPLGLGSDIGGSVRVPAAFCGVCSLKPTAGRCDDMGEFWGPRGQTSIAPQVGVIAPTVADVALGTRIIAGDLDRQAITDMAPRWSKATPAPIGNPDRVVLQGLRVGLYESDAHFPSSPAVQRAVQEAARHLRAAGATVVPWVPPAMNHAQRLFVGLLGADWLDILTERAGGSTLSPQIRQLAMLSKLPVPVMRLLGALLRRLGQAQMAEGLASFGPNTVGHYWRLVEAQLEYQARALQALNEVAGGPVDAVLAPVCAVPAYTHGASVDLLTAGAYASLYNLLGWPAVVVPVTHVRADEERGREPSRDRIRRLAAQVDVGSAGLPVGVQIAARPWREDIVLAVMAAIEAPTQGGILRPSLAPAS